MANKDFSILKWVIFPPVCAALSGGIAFFNIDVFGWRGSVMYLAALASVNAISLVMLNFSGSTKRPVRIAAFTIECLLIAALVVNISFSLSMQRDMSVVRQGAASHNEALDKISKLHGGRTQRAALATIGESADVRSAFKEYEQILKAIMLGELSIAMGGLVLVYGIAAIKPGVRRMPRRAFIGARPVVSGAILDQRQAIGFGKPVEARGSKMEANSDALESGWNRTESYSNLRLTGQGSGVRVRDGSGYSGHITWSKYLAGVRDPDRPTEEEIRNLLSG